MTHLGRPYTFSALGKDWTLARWTYLAWVELVEIAKTLIPDPRQEVADMLKVIPEIPIEDKMKLVREANRKAATMFEYGSKEMLAWIGTTTGTLHTLHTLLKPNHSDATIVTAEDIIKSESVNFDDAFAVVSGQVPEKKDSPGG